MPPIRNGIADYARALTDALSGAYDCDIRESEEAAGAAIPPGARALHQLGNNPGHAFVLRALRRVPGVVTLHDMTLAVPARLALPPGEIQAARPALWEGLGKPWLEGGRLPGAAASALDLLRPALRGARAVVVHSRHAEGLLRQRCPELALRCAVIPHLALPGPYDREAARVALGLPRDAFVILTAGFASRAKRLGWVAEAVAALAPRRPGLLWLHAGEWDEAVTGPPGPVVERLRAEGRLRVTGFLEESALGLHIAACDVLANLRAPSVGESSGTLARALAAGRCALVSDTGAYAELPRDAVLALPALAPQRAMVAALAALSRDPGLCDAIGERARLFARTVLSPDSVARAYRAVIEDFRAAPPPLAVPPGPAHPVPLRGARPRILLVSPLSPLPVRAGNAARIHRLAGALASRGLPMELAAPPRKASGGDDASPWLARHPIPWRPARFPAHADRWALDDWCPPETVEAVAALHRQGRYDVVIASYTWMSAVLEAVPGAFRVLDTHDLVGGRAAEAARLGLAPSWFWTGLAEEAAGLARAELVLGIQPEESEVLRRRGARAVLTVGHAAGPGAVPPRARGPAAWDFGLLASANVWNLHGVAALDRALAPHPGIPWLLAGEAGVAGGFRSAGMAIGPVAEAGAFYRLVDCVVNPVEGGTGLKIKTVEALGLGHPVIGTRHAFAGLGARHPAQQAGDAAAVAGWMAEHRASPALRTELLAASRELAGRWHASVEEGLDRLAALLRAGRVNPAPGTGAPG